MPYYLHHYFDPYFDYQKLKPKQLEKGKVDYYNLGYVQNVIAGQVLAEWKEIAPEDVDQYDQNFIYDKKEFPIGPNCAVNPQNEDQLIATANGYVFYYQGKIAVKTVLNVRRDVDFHTGNIYFVGDMIVHGSVRSGFEIRANNIRVKRLVEGAKVEAGGSMVIEEGVKGSGQALIKAGENLRTPFCEKAELVVQEKLIIDGLCLHSVLFAGKYVMVKGRLIGGHVCSSSLVYAGEQLGGGMGAKTVLVLGYDALLFREVRQIEQSISELKKDIFLVESKLRKGPEYEKEYGPKLRTLEGKLRIFTKKREELWTRMEGSLNHKARVICPGEIRPGVEISIGPAYYKVDDFLQDVCFYFEDDEIKLKSPAMDN
ncbi:DUF342 domain-containing protein [Desulfohalobiaceae bacterium Ax17]|uniref:DUF342 domain-containing protein n=1 Tax=Desulfovulcanus ferrireducens TaxID=2831190 RepID=UPI00207BAD49|nr:FapA family protein [Desulfovulcanus ferrireducens]MBT8764196.1 DUF342 domain-containing protein [Desulfovulcanus ferrireducens]